jgi:hypothetical protein
MGSSRVAGRGPGRRTGWLYRISLAASVAMLCAVGLATTSLAVSTQPVLGTTSFGAPAAVGFGLVKPKTVFLGGDPTGDFKHLSWQNWGKPKATGHGMGFYDPPGKSVAASVKAKVTLVASSLGECGGRLAYRRLAVSFLYHGHSHAGTKLSLCS